jgi:hypothetical protein
MARFFADLGAFLTPLYALFNGKTLTSEYAIGAATRSGETWSEYAGNPVLTVGTPGAWDDAHVKDPCLVWDGSQYVMFYAGHDGTKYQVGRATAPSHEGPWTRDGGNPVLAVGSGGAFDDSGVAFPTILYEPGDTGKEWKCWYYANDGSAETIGYAHSSDGISWTKVGQVIAQGAGGSWYDEGALPGAILKEAGTYYLFVGGQQDPTQNKWQGGLWAFTDPEGTYTAEAGNPTILARFNDAPISLAPTADVDPGDSTVGLADTTKYNVGEPIVIADAISTAENFYVTAKDTSSLTLDHQAQTLFEVAQGARVRPFSMVSIIPRSILARPAGGYEAFVTIFQPVEDLTQPASKLWEGSFEMRADALTDVWDYYYLAGRGLLFPLEPVGVSWHTRSAENPSVIAAP